MANSEAAVSDVVVDESSRSFISWTNEEKDKLLDLMLQGWKRSPLTNIVELARNAQEQLPKERRKNLLNRGQLGNVADEFHKRMIAHINQPVAPPITVEVPVEKEVKIPTSQEVLQQADVGTLLVALAGKFNERFDALEAKMRYAANGRSPVHHHTEVTVTRAAVPRIAVVGLIGHQERVVENAIGDRADLRFIDKDQSSPRFPHCDYIVLVTKFISHYWDNAACSHLPKDRVFRHRGGVGELIQLIEEVVEGKTR